MSLYKNYYIIAGYDLSAYQTDKYEDWKWTDEGEQYICRHSKGNIQLFDDPCNGDHFYLGYVLVHGDQYEFNTTVIDLKDVPTHRADVEDVLFELYKIGVIDNYFDCVGQYNVFVFEEVT
jgi:hypothetical protein